MQSGSHEPNPLLDSQGNPRETKQSNPPGSGKKNTTGPTPTGLQALLKRLACPWWAVLSVVINVVFVIIFFVYPAMQREPCPAAPAYTVAACPDGWVGYMGQCYYFSEDEEDWDSSQSNCSAQGASLAVIHSPQEMAFLMRYKEPSHYWIGLQRDQDQPWKWTNSTEFNNWFKIEGEEQCAFISLKISSSSCSGEERWICSQPAKKTEDKAKDL